MWKNIVLIPENNVSLYKTWATLLDIIFMFDDREKIIFRRLFCV